MKAIYYALILLFSVLYCSSAEAQTKHILLKIDNVDGESLVPGHVDEIDITAFEQMSNTCSDPSMSCQVTLGNFVLQKKLDISSNELRRTMFSGRPYPEVTITYTLENSMEGSMSDYYTIVLEDAYVTSYKEVYSDASGGNEEQFTFQAMKIKYTYNQLDSHGAVIGSNKFGWDVETNREIVF